MLLVFSHAQPEHVLFSALAVFLTARLCENLLHVKLIDKLQRICLVLQDSFFVFTEQEFVVDGALLLDRVQYIADPLLEPGGTPVQDIGPDVIVVKYFFVRFRDGLLLSAHQVRVSLQEAVDLIQNEIEFRGVAVAQLQVPSPALLGPLKFNYNSSVRALINAPATEDIYWAAESRAGW